MKFAHYPPVESDFLASRLWDKFMRPEWKQWATEAPREISPERERELLDILRRMENEGRATEPFDSDDADELHIQRKVPMEKGSWRLLPREVKDDRTSQ